MTTNSFPSDTCAMCGKTFDEALNDDTSGEWTVHWDTALGVRIIAETCGPTCSDMFEESYRAEDSTIK